MRSLFFSFVSLVSIILLVTFLGNGSFTVGADQQPDMAVVVNGGTERSITLIDPVTDTAFGPFLQGMLGSPGTGLSDVVVTSDGSTAIVSNCSDRRIFFIDLDSMPPRLLESVLLPICPQDIAMSPDSRFVLVTGDVNDRDVISVDIATQSIVDQVSYEFVSIFASAVAIASDGETVLIADFVGSAVRVFRLKPDGTLEETEKTIGVDGRPFNIAISPDGRTVIVSNYDIRTGKAFSDTITILRIDEALNPIVTATLRGLPGAQQGAIFSPDGSKALVISLIPRPDQVSVFNVFGPGMVTDTGNRVDLLSQTSGFIGIDTIAVSPDSTKAYVANPGYFGVASRIAVIDLTADRPLLIRTIPMPIPVGIAFPR